MITLDQILFERYIVSLRLMHSLNFSNWNVFFQFLLLILLNLIILIYVDRLFAHFLIFYRRSLELIDNCHY
jgi:hypothetical protein